MLEVTSRVCDTEAKSEYTVQRRIHSSYTIVNSHDCANNNKQYGSVIYL
jgi:hypothetical protein